MPKDHPEEARAIQRARALLRLPEDVYRAELVEHCVRIIFLATWTVAGICYIVRLRKRAGQ